MQFKKKMVSAYGGRGLALHRLHTSDNIQDNNLLHLATEVSLHRNLLEPIQSNLRLVRNNVFAGGVGFQLRSATKSDNMPENCWFRGPEQLSKLVTSEDEAKKKPKKVKGDEPPKIQEKPADNTKNELKFGIGKAYGSTSRWNDRYMKASNAEIAKSVVQRLAALQMISRVNKATYRFKDEPSISAFPEFVRCLLQYRRVSSTIVCRRHYVKENKDLYCLCHYYPYYLGLFWK